MTKVITAALFVIAALASNKEKLYQEEKNYPVVSSEGHDTPHDEPLEIAMGILGFVVAVGGLVLYILLQDSEVKPVPAPASEKEQKADSAPAYLIKEGRECSSTDKNLGDFGNFNQCAAAVKKNDGKFFSFGTGKKAGKCYMEETASAACTQGWEVDEYNFYGVGEAPAVPTGICVKSAEYSTVSYKTDLGFPGAAGNDIACGRFATQKAIEDFCTGNETCKGYSYASPTGDGVNMQWWCAKTSPEKGTAVVEGTKWFTKQIDEPGTDRCTGVTSQGSSICNNLSWCQWEEKAAPASSDDMTLDFTDLHTKMQTQMPTNFTEAIALISHLIQLPQMHGLVMKALA